MTTGVRALVIGERERQIIRELLARVAESVPIDAKRAIETMAPEAIRERNRAFTIALPEGYRVTLTHELQPKMGFNPGGLFKHLSVSVTAPMKAPSPAAVEMILDEFGMRPLLDSEQIWSEQFDRNRFAINILQRAAREASNGRVA
jgi:hypothetical protein